MQIQPALKAKLSLISIVYSNKIYTSVMLSRNKKGQKKSVGLIQKQNNNFALAVHFFVHFSVIILHDYNVKLPETSLLHILWKKCCMCSCSLFLTATHFHLGGRYQLSFSHHHYKISMFFFQQNWSPLFLISHSSSFSVIQVKVHLQTLKLSQKKELALLLLFFISISLGGYAIYHQNRWMQNFTPAYMKGWMHIRTILSEPKFLGCIDNQIFLPMVLRCMRLRY